MLGQLFRQTRISRANRLVLRWYHYSYLHVSRMGTSSALRSTKFAIADRPDHFHGTGVQYRSLHVNHVRQAFVRVPNHP